MKLVLNLLGVICAGVICWLGAILIRNGEWQIGWATWVLFLYGWSKYGLLILLEKDIKE